MSVQENPWSVGDGDVDGMAELSCIAIDLFPCRVQSTADDLAFEYYSTVLRGTFEA